MKEQPNGTSKFLIVVEDRQNATWQGTITLPEENRTVHFRSALELIKLMDEVISENQQYNQVFKEEKNEKEFQTVFGNAAVVHDAVFQHHKQCYTGG